MMRIMTETDEISYAEVFNRREARIDSDFGCRPVVFELLRKVGLSGRWADIGCSSGYVTRVMASVAEPGSEILGCDTNRAMIQDAIRIEQESPLGILYEVGDTLNLSYKDRSLNGVVSVNVMGHFTPEEVIRAYRETRRVLVPGGTFILAVPSPLSYIKPPKTPAIAFHYESAPYQDGQCVPITLHQSPGARGKDINAYFNTIESYHKWLEDEGFTIQEYRHNKQAGELKRTYQQIWGGSAEGMEYDFWIAKRTLDTM